MASVSESLKGFRFLTESLPEQIIQLDKLSTQVAERYSEFSKLPQIRPLERKKRKNLSTESLRPIEYAVDENEHPTFSAPRYSLPRHMSVNPDNKHLFREVRRLKRKPESILSAASGPVRYRMCNMLSIYYDSAIQQGFEELVRHIGMSRNNLRKGKSAATFKSRMATIGIDDGDLFPGENDFPGICPRANRVADQERPNVTSPTTSSALDEADKDLEIAQVLCEVAAHQMLRDGDCEEEITGTRERFQNCLQIAKAQVERLEAEKEMEVQREQVAKDQEQTKEDVAPDSAIHLVDDDPVSQDSAAPAVEVNEDEYDDEALKIDLSQLRRTRNMVF